MNSKIKLIDTSYGKNRDVIIDKLSKEIGKNYKINKKLKKEVMT